MCVALYQLLFAVIKYHDPKQLTQGEVYLGLMVLEKESMMVGEGWQQAGGEGNSEITSSPENTEQRGQTGSQADLQTLRASPMTFFLQQGHTPQWFHNLS